MPIRRTNDPADDFAADLGRLIGQASDNNRASALEALSQQALGAFHATGDERFCQLANYAAECAVRLRVPNQTAATRH